MSGLLDKFTALYKFASTLGNADLVLQISDLKMELSTVYNENLELKEENRKLKKNIDNPLIFDPKRNACFEKGKDIPFCPRCYQVDGNRVNLIFFGTSPYCQQCKEWYPTPQ
jgi:regulator of replication initiation timing